MDKKGNEQRRNGHAEKVYDLGASFYSSVACSTGGTTFTASGAHKWKHGSGSSTSAEPDSAHGQLLNQGFPGEGGIRRDRHCDMDGTQQPLV